jgi:hypothetical protein
MRHLARFSFESTATESHGGQRAEDVLKKIDNWIRSKGTLSEDGKELALPDGRVAEVRRGLIQNSLGLLHDIEVTEPRPDGWFRTSLTIGDCGERITVYVVLSAAAHQLMPVFVDVYCPRIVRDLLSPPSVWRFRGTQMSSVPIRFSGESGGDQFVSLVWGSSRAVPVVAVSEQYGFEFHPEVADSLAGDLAGLAIVGRLDAQASWRVTQRKGKEWSCYGGAIRIYWPQGDDEASPYRHPLWTAARLLDAAADTESAADRIRRELRRRVLGQSAFAVSADPAIAALRRAAEEEELKRLRDKAESDSDFKGFVDELFSKLCAANELLAAKDRTIEEQSVKLRGLSYALQSKKGADPGEIEPDTETPPTTVEDAVLMAMDQFGDYLVFGADVTHGVGTLRREAGPPEKILKYLRVLAEYTQARQSGKIGMTAVKWLEQRNVTASRESETVMNSGGHAWDGGDGQSMTFDLHLKPTNATSPDLCVRIYFEYHEHRQKTVVGWVGRHP